jgi:hypothetical protein
MDGHWICIKCKEEKPLDSFYKKKTTNNGFANVCKKCDNERTKSKDKRRSNESAIYFIKRLISGKSSTKRENRTWDKDITPEVIYDLYKRQDGLCAITKEKLTHIAGKGKIKTNISIDRIDSNLPYTIDNIQLVCYIVNIMKNSFTKEELKEWCYKIYKNI